MKNTQDFLSYIKPATLALLIKELMTDFREDPGTDPDPETWMAGMEAHRALVDNCGYTETQKILHATLAPVDIRPPAPAPRTPADTKPSIQALRAYKDQLNHLASAAARLLKFADDFGHEEPETISMAEVKRIGDMNHQIDEILLINVYNDPETICPDCGTNLDIDFNDDENQFPIFCRSCGFCK